jgi:hypothetical protein
MSYAVIRSELKTLLEAIPDVQIVHDHLRWTNKREEILSFYGTSGVLSAWEFTRVRNARGQQALPNRFRSRHFMRIKGYYALADSKESEKVFQDLLDRVLDTLQLSANLNGKATLLLPPDAAIDHQMKGNTLVHRAEIALEIIEDVTF